VHLGGVAGGSVELGVLSLLPRGLMASSQVLFVDGTGLGLGGMDKIELKL
jgi:hypothetical protein